MMSACDTLEGYSVFVDKIRQNHKEGKELKDAIQMSADYCIAHNFLKDFLLKHTGEALNMILSLYDEELHNRTIREEGREEGLADGLARGREEGRYPDREPKSRLRGASWRPPDPLLRP